MANWLHDNAQAHERHVGVPLPGGAPDSGAVRVVDGGRAVEIDAGGGRWRRLVSARDPDAEADRWVEAVLGAAAPVSMVLVGGGLGFVLDAMERRRMDAPVVIVEPDAALARLLLERRDWRAWIERGRLALLVGPAYAGVPAVAARMDALQTARVHVHPVLARAWPDHVRQALAVVERLRFESAANGHARRTLAAPYLRQTLANAARIAREGDAAALDGLMAGRPAVIAAAGPSLDANVHDLHRVRDRALLVACDTAARPLLSLGLEPHLVVAIDPSVSNACHLGALHDPRRTWLVAEGSLHPSAFAHFEGRTFFARVGDHAPWPWLRTAGLDPVRLSAWGSVLTTAFDLVRRMGCDPIVIVGADLAFTGGRPYCRGTTLEAQWASWVAGGETYERAFAMLVDRWPSVTAEDVHGRPVRTAAHLVSFRDWVAARAAEAAPVRVINATGAGILHGPAIRLTSATEALAGRPLLDAGELQRALAARHDQPRRSARLFEQIAALERDGWPLPAPWSMPGTEAAPEALRAALAGPEYTAWRLGRTASPSSLS